MNCCCFDPYKTSRPYRSVEVEIVHRPAEAEIYSHISSLMVHDTSNQRKRPERIYLEQPKKIKCYVY